MNLETIFGNPVLKRLFKMLFVLALIVVLGLGFYVKPHHIYFPWDELPNFNAIFGLVGGSIVIVFSKVIVQWFISKKEDYYDR